ncbi:hypothetical protein BJY27_002125 [Streptomyces rapamycinicus]|uniref:Uncharacterized protein n=2 Tax=Streptomyces rapamycinicus TaxID=1226757 RepID=A0A3L8R3G2_STRRN|nr:hypothetical protein [Streptomyces rapamycinicus]RLV74191.1 hypothetical protein D3C57_133235 [Streptomyces rapamycinicus NRRL 5491]
MVSIPPLRLPLDRQAGHAGAWGGMAEGGDPRLRVPALRQFSRPGVRARKPGSDRELRP